MATPRDVEQETAYRQTVEAVRPYYEQAKRARQAGGDGRWRRGVGIASMRYGIGYTYTLLPQSIAELDSDGRVRLLSARWTWARAPTLRWRSSPRAS